MQNNLSYNQNQSYTQQQINQNSYPSNLEQTVEQENYQVLVRKADLDDIDELMQLITQDSQEAQDLLYDYPKLVTLFERSFLSVTVLDSNQRIVGCAVFNDYPQGLFGKIDFQHENFWEYWLFDAFDFLEDQFVSPYNSLWLTYMFIAKEAIGLEDTEELKIVEKIFQNVYNSIPYIENILFLKRGETADSDVANQEIGNVLQQFFVPVECKDREIIRTVRGIHSKSELFYSPKSVCTEIMEIRMAKEQDHDDLAEIFNKQSEVLTQQFGEFFIADLIATQNQTRRVKNKLQNEGRAIVGQVRDKAVGLMSISQEIDYKLLASCFELETYDNLFKPEYMDAIRNRRQDISEQLKWEQYDQKLKTAKALQEEFLKCQIIGQRMTLQQFCIQISNQIEITISEYLADPVKQKNDLSDFSKVEELLDGWLEPFKDLMHQPSEMFKEYFDQYPEIETCILTPRELLLETLQYFGLPDFYMQGNGHWKDWEKKKREEMKTKKLRKFLKKTAPKAHGKKKKEQEEAERRELAPPEYFDLVPFQESFKKFISITPEMRTGFRQQIETNMKKVVMNFCNENGELNAERSMDINDLGRNLAEEGMDKTTPEIQENMASFLKCFGNIQFDQETILIPVQEEKDAKSKAREPAHIKKHLQELQKQPQMQEKVLFKCNFEDFQRSIQIFKEFDLQLSKIGCIQSSILSKELKQIQEDENLKEQKQLNSRKINREHNEYDSDPNIQNLETLEELPQEIPLEAQNAVVINLYCVDENFESRSLDFVEYAFSLFPDKDYLILTQPYSVQETSLLSNFIQIPMKKNSTFDHVLYIYHKDALASNAIYVRKSKLEDVYDAKPLIEGLYNQEQVEQDCINAIKNTAKGLQCFSVFCDTQLIGMYVVSKTVNLDYYVSHFCVQDHLILKEHPKPFHTKLKHSILNPLFYKATRFILREILRLTGKTCLYFEVESKTLLPDIFNELVFVRARTFPHFLKRKWDFEHDEEHFERAGDLSEVTDGNRDAFDQEESPFSLSMITKKMLSNNKVSNNNRIVVVGASDTGISFIESLLTIKDIHFTHITLLAPGGLHTMHIQSALDQLKAMSTNYTMEELRNLMLDARVSVLDAKMVKLDKKKKRIDLDKDAYLNYDILVISVGLIDQVLQSPIQIKQEDQGEERDNHFYRLYSTGLKNSYYYKNQLRINQQIMLPNTYKMIDGVYSIDDPYLQDSFKINDAKDSNINLLTRKKRPHNITVYGRTLHTISFISGLLNRGVKPERIKYVIPPLESMKKKDDEEEKDFDEALRRQEELDLLNKRPGKDDKLSLSKRVNEQQQIIEQEKVLVNEEQLGYNELKLKEEDEKINDPDPFENEDVQNKVFEYLESVGVEVFQGYNLYQILTDPKDEQQSTCKSVIFRKRATNYKDIKLEIADKEQELKILKEDSDNNNSAIYDDGNEINVEENKIKVLSQEITQLRNSLNDDRHIQCRFLITSGLVDIDTEIFQIIHDNGLVYNGRLIVKSNFQTTENEIFCCGKICEFSQRYKNDSIGKSLRLDKYNGRELGQKLSKCILEYLDLSYLTDQLYNSEQLPNLYMPIGIGSYLPGQVYYYHIKKNDFGRPKLTQKVKNARKPLTSDNLKLVKGPQTMNTSLSVKNYAYQGNYISFKFDNNGLIDSVTYAGTEEVSVQALISFVGLSEKYFNRLQQKFDKDLIPNVNEFLSENWAMALYHEWFSEFRHLTKQEILQSDNVAQILEETAIHARDGKFLEKEFLEEIKAKLAPEIVKVIQQGTLDFISENQNHLPMYYIPKKKVQVE